MEINGDAEISYSSSIFLSFLYHNYYHKLPIFIEALVPLGKSPERTDSIIILLI